MPNRLPISPSRSLVLQQLVSAASTTPFDDRHGIFSNY
jgi:hypothetical protein